MILTGRPGKSHASVKETLEHQRKNYTTNRSSCCSHSSSRASLGVEEMSNGGDCWSENQRCPSATENAKDDDKVPILGADTQQEYGKHQKHCATEQEVARSIYVKDGADDESSAEREEDVD